MKIFIPEVSQAIGGPVTFLNNLRTYANNSEISLAHKIEESNILFFPIATSLENLYRAKRSHVTMVQRLDGLHYYGRNGISYLKKNLKIQIIYKYISEYKIFQSGYSKAQCYHLFSPIPESTSTIIYNGCDENRFYPNTKNSLQGAVRFVMTGNFRHADMLKPIIEALDLLRFEFKLTVVGPVPDHLRIHLKRNYVNWIGPKSSAETASVLRENDIYLFSALNPPCPNAVIEAVTTGMPIVAYDSGAMKELCGFSKELLAETPDKLLHSVEDFDPTIFASKVRNCVDNFTKLKALSLENRHNFRLEKMGAAYFDFFQKVSLSR